METKRFETEPEIPLLIQRAAQAKMEIDLAVARHDAIQQRVSALIYKGMAEMGLSPAEWECRQDEEGLYFQLQADVVKAEKEGGEV